jgi:nucleoside 2-deoxyribosyltransferase
MIYLACPYWHDDETIRRERVQTVTACAAVLAARGVRVFSPLTYSWAFEGDGIPENYWLALDLEILKAADRLLVLAMMGWTQSRGVMAEMGAAYSMGIPVKVIDPQTVDLDKLDLGQ